MAQSIVTIPNSNGSTFRANLNTALSYLDSPRKTYTTLPGFGAISLNLDTTQGLFLCPMTANITGTIITYTPSAGGVTEAPFFQLVLKTAGTAYTFAWPSNWTSMSGTWIDLGVNDTAIIEGISYDGGTTWLVTFATTIVETP